MLGEQVLPEVVIQRVNFIDVVYNNPLLDSDYYPTVDTVPRYVKNTERSPKSDKNVEKHWNPETMIFRNFKTNEEVSFFKRKKEYFILNCFEKERKN